LTEEKEAKVPVRWISLRQASTLLGVNPSTLRRWADAGQVRIFRTPGGHRRFSEADLEALMAGKRPPAAQSYEALAGEAAGRIRRSLQAGEPSWLRGLDEKAREELYNLASRVFELASRFLSRPTRRGRFREEARRLGREYGQKLSAAGLSFQETLETFSLFRRTLLNTALEMAQKGGLAIGDLAETSAQVGELADEVLLAMSEAFLPPGHELQKASTS